MSPQKSVSLMDTVSTHATKVQTLPRQETQQSVGQKFAALPQVSRLFEQCQY